MENKVKAARLNPITYVSKDDPAFLIVHGDRDSTVPINQSQLLFEALKKIGLTPHLHVIHGVGHGGPGFNEPKIEEMVAQFFDAQLKGKATPGSTAEAQSTESTFAPSAIPAAPATANRGVPTFDEILDRMDTNKDGKISREEFRGPPGLFQRLDRNGDGFITREEHEAGPLPGK